MGAFERAAHFATDVHADMVRKGAPIPFLIHPFEVASIAASITTDEDVLVAALLHDVVEETPTPLEEVRELFGDRVAALVSSETENKYEGLPKSETWQRRKEESLRKLSEAQDIGMKILWLSDKLANLRSFAAMKDREGDAMWKRFNQSDPRKHAWYFRSVLALTGELSHTRAWREYDWLVDELFGKVG